MPNPHFGKCHYNPCPNDTKRIGIQRSGNCTSKTIHRLLRGTMGNQPRAEFSMYTQALPKSVFCEYTALVAHGTFTFGLFDKKKGF